jgi:PPR repeat family
MPSCIQTCYITEQELQQQQDGALMDLRSYNMLIKAYRDVSGSDALEGAFAAFERLQSSSTLKPDSVSYNTLIDTCCRCGEVRS